VHCTDGKFAVFIESCTLKSKFNTCELKCVRTCLGHLNDNICNEKKNHFKSRAMETRQKKCSTNFKYALHRYSVDDKPIALLTVNFRAVQRTSQHSVFTQVIQANPSELNVM
jgi:hypothetical protein